MTTKVLLKACWNIAEKLGETELLRFYQQMAVLGPEMVPSPSRVQMERCIPPSRGKDAHVLAGALECGAAYLVTLDRRHLLTPAVESAGLPVRVMTPGDFLREVVIQEER